MKKTLKALRKGFTLLEMTVVMLVGMGLASMIMAMLNQQIAFLNIYRAQSFLNEEVPIVSYHISKLLSGAERFSLHDNINDAQNRDNQRPDSTITTTLVLFSVHISFHHNRLAGNDPVSPLHCSDKLDERLSLRPHF